jgi:threonylcarbamoyladenosine tRNA methylthiotransferase MtaB
MFLYGFGSSDNFMKVFLDMVGCRLNQSELENYARQFRLAGHTLTSNAESADLIVINTCTVTLAAASDSRQKIRRSVRSSAGQVIVTGCWATINPHETAQLPGVTQVIVNEEKDDLVPLVLNLPMTEFNHKMLQREPIPGTRLRTRAFIKVQDGCDNYCTYCITRLARGAGRSREINDILEDIHFALDGGTQEIVLTGAQLGSWGYDFHTPMNLLTLVSVILTETDTPRLRLSSLEPWDIHPDFYRLWQNPRLCRHLHLPLQSGSEATLKRMNRRVTPGSFAELVRHARTFIPGVAITTDIIAGFPGESEAEFLESSVFVKEMDFANGHVFTYSAWRGTAAAMLPDQVPHEISKQRSARMREILLSSASTYREKHLGQSLQVLWEKATPVNECQWKLSGLSENYLRVSACSSAPCHNQLTTVRITGIKQNELVGVITNSESQFLTSEDTL